MINPKGLELIKEFEGCKLEAYDDGGGVWTIGFGHTSGVKKGDTCTEIQATSWLLTDLIEAEKSVKRHVEQVLNENQLAALISFVYNLGIGNFARSTLLRSINKNEWVTAANQFSYWDKLNGIHSPGLARRRAAERDLFLTPV